MLLTCGRRDFEATRQLLNGPIDWEFLLHAAGHHGMGHLLFNHFQSNSLDSVVPEEVRSKLQRRLYANAARNEILVRELLRIIDRVETAGVAALPHKGPVLALLDYGDLAYREFSDLDILIPKSRYSIASRVLKELGYEPHRQEFEGESRFGLGETDQEGFRHTESGIFVELQWGLLPEWRVKRSDFATLWERATTVCLGDREVKTLGREDMLLALGVHGSKHLWSRMEWLLSFAEFVRHYGEEIDFGRVTDEARGCGCLPMMLLAFWMAKELLGVPPPLELPSGPVPAIGQFLRDRLLSGVLEDDIDPVRRFQIHMQLTESRPARARMWLHAITHPRPADWDSVRLPKGLYFLYYIFRPVRLVYRYMKRRTRRNSR